MTVLFKSNNQDLFEKLITYANSIKIEHSKVFTNDDEG
jgi:hypothetical protein